MRKGRLANIQGTGGTHEWVLRLERNKRDRLGSGPGLPSLIISEHSIGDKVGQRLMRNLKGLVLGA